ncbi:hypothetical protein [Oceanobacillus halotolerans]|uniref:hypothetical protein n=1 Tax=Oceanobacillus halotolerans TaxID=2663380 RepID=UPI0013D90837|nr:hypothetical protein [Oceanobacillus halotolerans]
MYYQLYQAYLIIQRLLANFPVNNNPLELRISPLLSEANNTLLTTLQLIQQPQVNEHHLKYLLSVIYRNDEALDPLTRAWGRASLWMDSASPTVIHERLKWYKAYKKELEQLVPNVKSLYGEEEARYIVPPLYRKEVGA